LLPEGNNKDSGICQLIGQGESSSLEFKSSLSFNHGKTPMPPKVMNGAVLKTIAAFSNTHGGTILIGVSDSGELIGLNPDYSLKHRDRDQFERDLFQLIHNSMGLLVAKSCRISFLTEGDKEICRVEVPASPVPVFADVPDKEQAFFYRRGNATHQLGPRDTLAYASSHWPPMEARVSTRTTVDDIQ